MLQLFIQQAVITSIQWPKSSQCVNRYVPKENPLSMKKIAFTG